MRYDKPQEVEYSGAYDPDGQCVNGFVTEVVDQGTTFGLAAANLVGKLAGKKYERIPPLLMTTRDHWSGYSEYTVTNLWSEIILTVPAWEWEKEWPSLGDFLRAMADANPEADDR